MTITAEMTVFVQHGSHAIPRKGVSVIGDTQRELYVTIMQAQVSAILNCNCVTYDIESKSTYAGPCFYNCMPNE